MSTMLSVFGPTLALYLLSLCCYTTAETIRSLCGGKNSKELADRMSRNPAWRTPAERQHNQSLRLWIRG